LGKWTENCSKLCRIYTHYYDQGTTYRYKNEILRKINPGNNEPIKKGKLSAQAVPAIYTLTGITLKTKQLKIIDPEIPRRKQFQGHLPTIVIIVTDASVHPPEAVFAWIITNKKGRIITKYSNKIEENNISSYRAEAYGILDAIEFIHQFKDQIREWSLYCDNEALIKQLQASHDTDKIPTE
jgi:Reverse transcriptase-like